MDEDALGKMAGKLGGKVSISKRTAVITVTPERLVDACTGVASMPGFYHLTTITGIDDGQEIEIMYHFWRGTEFVSVRTTVGKDEPNVPSVSPALPAALLYESEVHDLLGVNFQGHPLMGRKLLLPDNYPKDAPPPLRREANPEEIRRMMGLE